MALANETGKDIYINVPSNVSASYLTNLADLFAYGSNGVTPYTSVQSDPVWTPLNPNLKVYIEFSNETWNYGFAQAESRGDGWANQLSQRALYDYLTNNQNDPLYPGGGSNAYNDGAILASYYDVNSSNDSAFLSTYNANPAPSTDGGSPVYFSNSAAINGFTDRSGLGRAARRADQRRLQDGLRRDQCQRRRHRQPGSARVRVAVRRQLDWRPGLHQRRCTGRSIRSTITCTAAAAAGTPTTRSAASVTSVSPTPPSPTVSPAGRPAARRGWSPTDPLWATPTPRLFSPPLPSPTGPPSRETR